MADTAPIELPTSRRSFVAPVRDGPNIHDKNWIPILDATNPRNAQQPQNLDLTLSISDSFYSFPKPSSGSNSSIQRPKLMHNYSRSSLAPESVTTEVEAESLKARTSSKKLLIASALNSDSSLPHLPHESAAPSSDGQDTVTSGVPSTIGTGSMIEEQYYTLPDAPVSKSDIHPPLKREPAPLSAPLSTSANPSRASVLPPTSKYNRKPVSVAASTRPSSAKSQTATPNESPKMQPALPPGPPPIPQSDIVPSLQAAAEESSQATPPMTPKLSSKSSASERRLRNLASPTSKLSLSTQFPAQPQPQGQASSINSPSSSDDADMRPRPPSTRHKSRKSTDSRSGATRSPIYDSTTPTPAPTTPLPQLPSKPSSRRPSVGRSHADGSGVRTIPVGPSHIHSQSRPSSSHTSVMPQVQPSHPAPPQPAVPATLPAPSSLPDPDTLPRPSTNEHVELAEFMSRRSTVIFRRFDDVHVKLLFCLQDEIAQLEEELGQLEAASAAERTGAKMMRVMRDLRKVVAEYGMFSYAALFLLSHNLANEAVWDRSPVRQLGANASQQSLRSDTDRVEAVAGKAIFEWGTVDRGQRRLQMGGREEG
ncbi:hypothetical protein DV736_g4137, partial [Chaetothyriales sp. CBS 134916]